MKRIFPIIISLILTFCTISCSKYAIKTDIEKDDNLAELKKVGIILRIAQSSRITKEEQTNNIAAWVSNYESTENISIIPDCSNEISHYSSIQDKFYQTSGNNNFLKFKTIGIINLYLRKNEDELKNIISQKSLDGLVIFETYSIISTGMQFMDFDSIIAVVDKNLNIIYLDHQTDGYDTDEQILDRAKNHLMDLITDRLLQKLLSLDFIGDIEE